MDEQIIQFIDPFFDVLTRMLRVYHAGKNPVELVQIIDYLHNWDLPLSLSLLMALTVPSVTRWRQSFRLAAANSLQLAAARAPGKGKINVCKQHPHFLAASPLGESALSPSHSFD